MRADVAHDLTTSTEDFMRVVVPAIRYCIGGGRVGPVESSTSTGMARSLDILAGIDAWQVVTDEGIRGISSRVQWDRKCWRTFTIREHRPSGALTELEKRMRGAGFVGRGYVYPHLTTHAYLTKDEIRGQGALLGVGVARTDDIMEYVQLFYPDRISDHPNIRGVWRRKNRADGVTFLCVPWDGMLAWGLRVAVIGAAP